MKHTYFHFPIPPLPPTNPLPMTDADWEQYILQREREETDHINATAPLSETYSYD